MEGSSRNRRLDVENSRAIISALGGQTAVAKMFGLSNAAVSAWQSKGLPEDRVQFLQVRYAYLPEVSAILEWCPWKTRR